MNYVLLGEDADLPLLLDAIGRSRSRLEAAAACESIHDTLLTNHPGLRLVDRWEDLLSLGNVGAAIVAGSDENVLAGARQLASDGVPLIVFPHFRTGSVFAYELSLIRDETGVPLIPATTQRLPPAIARFREQMERQSVGETVQLRCERTIAGQPGQPTVRLDADAIEHWLLRDADLLRWFGGEYNQVTALQTGRTRDGVMTARVTLAGDQLPEADWTLSSGDADAWSLTLIGQTSRTTLVLTDGEWGIDEQPVANITTQQTDAWLEAIESRISLPPQDQSEDPSGWIPSWTELTRAFEVVEGARESIRRRRTIDLFFETTSERNLFKTQMAAMGCLVLTWTLFGMVAYLIAGTLLGGGLPNRGGAGELSTVEYWFWHALRIIWIAPIVIFACAQLLLTLARPARSHEAAAQPHPGQNEKRVTE